MCYRSKKKENMGFVPLYEKLPEAAMVETRSITVMDEMYGVPMGEYALVEAFCNDKDCDCRRVMFNVVTPENQKTVAVIAYGWGTEKFYEKWFGEKNRNIIKTMQEPILNAMSEQGPYAKKLLELVKAVLKDESYVNRIKRHYKMFRDMLKEENAKEMTFVRSDRKIGRNDPCPCGSGKKFKKCCG